jgi:hypothetical protein
MGSIMAVTMEPKRVTYMERRASPTERKTPESAMPSAIKPLVGRVQTR